MNKVGTYNDNDHDENSKPWKVFQTFDGGPRWGIMTTNGYESLNNIFKKSRMLPVVVLVKDTFYKCIEWFKDRREKAGARIADGRRFSGRLEGLLVRRANKSQKNMSARSFGEAQGEYEVTVKNERVPYYNEQTSIITYKYETFRYWVRILAENQCECACRKPQLTGIPCSHILAVCRIRNFNAENFVHDLYSVNKLAETWSGQFHPFENQCEWPTYRGPTIVPDRSLIKLGRRKHKRNRMWMDDMQRRRMRHQASRSTAERNAVGCSNSLLLFIHFVHVFFLNA